MIKRTLVFATSGKLRLHLRQLVWEGEDGRSSQVLRKGLLKDGFSMLQYSVYIRHCASKENMLVYERRVKMMTPDDGTVSLLAVTDRQFGEVKTLYGKKVMKPTAQPAQLEFF